MTTMVRMLEKLKLDKFDTALFTDCVCAYSVIYLSLLCRRFDGSFLNRIGTHTVDEAAFCFGVPRV